MRKSRNFLRIRILHKELFEEIVRSQIEVLPHVDARVVADPPLITSNIPGTPLPDIVGEVLKEVAAVGTTSDQSLTAIPNTLNFSPPDPTLSSTASDPDAKCVKCSQIQRSCF